MSGDFNPDRKLPVEEDQTAALGFEPAARNVINIGLGHCPQCLKPMGVKGRKSAVVKVWTALGLDYWCEQCIEKGLEEKTCIKYRGFSKKERKQLRRELKKIEKSKRNE